MIRNLSSQHPSLYLTSVLRTLPYPTTEIPESLETVPQGPEPISGLLDRNTLEVGANSRGTATRRRGARGSGPGACFKEFIL